jgi:hypothetical protein
MNTLFEAKMAASDPAFLVHTCADIISSARECFDYLGQDIIECHIIPKTSNQRFLQDHSAGRLKAYFPFYDRQVSRPDSIFHELEAIEPSLYYVPLVDVKDMVNEKKHDKLIAVVSQADQEFLIENPGIKIILPMKAQKGWSSFSVETGSKITRATEYRFAHNNEEVGRFCLFATKVTDLVIEGFYRDHFS